jgi:hypothetical protein
MCPQLIYFVHTLAKRKVKKVCVRVVCLLVCMCTLLLVVVMVFSCSLAKMLVALSVHKGERVFLPDILHPAGDGHPLLVETGNDLGDEVREESPLLRDVEEGERVVPGLGADGCGMRTWRGRRCTKTLPHCCVGELLTLGERLAQLGSSPTGSGRGEAPQTPASSLSCTGA